MVRYNDETFEILEEDDEWFKLIKVKNKNATWYNIPEYINFIESGEKYKSSSQFSKEALTKNLAICGQKIIFIILVDMYGKIEERFNNSFKL